MEKATATDLIVGSHGKCFFCFQRNISPVSCETLTRGKYQSSPSVHSLHYLYRYLGMDIREMVNLEMTNSAQLHFNRKVPRPLVKVYLCEECSNENELFGKLYQQLEKIQMELISSLETIHMKLASEPANQLGLTNGLNDKLELVQTVRIKTTEKCYSKLRNELPRITVRRLSSKVLSPRRTPLDIKKSKVKNITDLQTDPSNRHSDEFDSVPTAAVKVEYVKVENSNEQDEMSDEGGEMDWLDNGTNSTSEGEDVQQFKLPPGTENVKNVMKIEGEMAKELAGGYSYVLIKPTKLAENLLKPVRMQSIVDSKTGQHKCRICSRTFTHSRGFQNHYRCKHLNEKYKCTHSQCGKIFNSQSTYYVHHKRMHMGIQFVCKVCRKCFGERSNLRRHQRKTSCGKGLAPTPVKHSCRCHLCGKGFTHSQGLRRHHKRAHLQQKRYECDLCGMKFTRNDNLKVHRRNIHQKEKIK